MQVQLLVPLALELRIRLYSGAFSGLGRVRLSDGVTVDAERMARIVLADIYRITRDDPPGWLTDGERQDLHDDLLRLLALVTLPVSA